MPGNVRPWNPDEWEKRVRLLLKRRYLQPGSYQDVPDTVHGDYGIEGFATDGTAYQSYAAQDWVTAGDLLKKQKNKLTSDIGKFARNKNELTKLFGPLKIGIWNLVVPYWNDKELLLHANTKVAEVTDLALEYVADPFRISIITEEDFAAESQLLANLDLYKFNEAAPAIPSPKLGDWMQEKRNLSLLENLGRKAQKLRTGKKSAEAEDKFRARIISNYIGGNIVLGRLERELPETFGKVMEYKATREANLETESFITSRVPSAFFEQTLQQYRDEISKVPGIGPSAADTIAREAVSDWLLRCPMDFEDAN